MNNNLRGLRDARHVDKEAYLNGDRRFYERGYEKYQPTGELKTIVANVVERQGGDWDLHRSDVWTHVVPFEKDQPKPLPPQGWKIHVSAAPNNCRAVLDQVASTAAAAGVQFKFANDENTLRMMTSKRWPRGGSGKFITLYPTTEAKFLALLEDLYLVLKGEVGPYILSDRRYKDCRCLYYRYGGFISVTKLDFLGHQRQVLYSPSGEAIEDRRLPYFQLPDWVKDPIPPVDAEEGDMALDGGRFEVHKALQFSNTGGVYLGKDRGDGKVVVIKEARPYVELRNGQYDAVSRLAQEGKILRELEGADVAPKFYASFNDWENFYIVEEYLADTKDMRVVMLEHSPLVKHSPTAQQSEEFYKIYTSIFISLLRGLQKIHHKGIVIGDVSPRNILIDSQWQGKFIDLEGAYRPGLDEPDDLHTPGFRAASKGWAEKNSFEDDRFGMGSMMLYGMFPLVALSFLREDIYSTILPRVVADIGWAHTPVLQVAQGLINNQLSCDEAIQLLQGPAKFDAPFSAVSNTLTLREIYRGMGDFVCHHVRLEAKSGLFPSDPIGALTNPASLGFGTVGIVWALQATGKHLPDEVLQRFKNDLKELKSGQLAPGFMIGTSGIAWGLLQMGDREAAARFLEDANASPLLHSHHSLFYGMAGVGMANLAMHLETQEPGYLDIAVDLAQRLQSTAIRCDRGIHWEDEGKTWVGFGYGQSGVALFFLRLSQVLGEPYWRKLGQEALEYDLSWAHEIEPGVVSFAGCTDDTTTYEQYLEEGSAGILKVAIRYGLWDRLEGLFNDVWRKYAAFPGLFFGLSGFIDAFVDAYLYSNDAKYLTMAERPIQGIGDLYLLRYPEGCATPGENLFRISCDYGSGVAGVMRTLYRRHHVLSDPFCLDVLDGFNDWPPTDPS
jgi:Lanthionine synthetase C-like protein/Protein kinase domain